MKILREPLVHFLLAGAALFALFAWLNDGDAPEGEAAGAPVIVVSAQQQERLASQFRGTWLRPPTPDEMAGLINAHVQEEILYREALKLGLDQGDTVVRRRLNQKMEFLTAAGAGLLEPSNEELQAYMQANAESYRVPPRLAFHQIYLGAAPEPATVEQARLAATALGAEAAGSEIGVATLLPSSLGPTQAGVINGQFGSGFAEALLTLKPGGWRGPVRSGYGLHLIHVTGREESRLPPLAEVGQRVAADWRAEKEAELRERQYEKLRAEYTVQVADMPPE